MGKIEIQITHAPDEKLSVSIDYQQKRPLIRRWEVKKSVIDDIYEACLELVEQSIYTRGERDGSSREQTGQELRTLGLALFQALFEAECDRFKQFIAESGDLDSIAFEIERDLAYLPFEVINDGNDFLALKAPIGRRILSDETESTEIAVGKPYSVLVVGDPTEDPLIRTDIEKEIDSIRNVFRKRGIRLRIEVGTTVDEKYLLTNLPSTTIFHFTGHGSISDDPDHVGIQIARDSVISGKTLSGLQEPPLIVFLNMCTASWREAWRSSVGLIETLLRRGTLCCIATLWDVRSQTASLLSSNFYRYLLSGSSLGEALRLARLDVIRQNGIADLSWAAYALYGDPAIRLTWLAEPPRKLNWRRAVVAVLIIIGSVLIPRHLSREPSQVTGDTTGYIVASSHPQGATIVLDGEPVGVTPSAIEVTSGRHKIVIARDGYRRWEAWIEVAPSKRTTVEATLEEIK